MRSERFRPHWAEIVIWALLLLVTFVSLVIVARVRAQHYAVAPESFASRAAGEPQLGIERIVAGPDVADPANAKVVTMKAGNSMLLLGWAVDTVSGQAASGVVLQIDEFDQVAATYGAERLDVVKAFKNPKFLNSGFEAEIPPWLLPRGTHEISFKVFDADAKVYYVLPNRLRVEVVP